MNFLLRGTIFNTIIKVSLTEEVWVSSWICLFNIYEAVELNCFCSFKWSLRKSHLCLLVIVVSLRFFINYLNFLNFFIVFISNPIWTFISLISKSRSCSKWSLIYRWSGSFNFSINTGLRRENCAPNISFVIDFSKLEFLSILMSSRPHARSRRFFIRSCWINHSHFHHSQVIDINVIGAKSLSLILRWV